MFCRRCFYMEGFMPEVAYNVDLLFTTDDNEEPGIMHVRVMAPREQSRLTIVIEVDSFTPIKENITSIISGIQRGIFNRIDTDAKSEANIFFETKTHLNEFPDSNYVKLVFNEGVFTYEKADKIEY